MYDKIEKTRDDLRQKLTFRRISGIMLAFCVIGIVCLFQLITTGFSLNALYSWDFYLRLIYRVALIFLVYQATINMLYDREIAAERVHNARNKYCSIVKLKDISLKEFLKVYNYNLKAEAWCDKIDRQINKYNRRMANGRFVKKYTAKVEELEKLKEDEYIKKYWDALPVKWNRVFYGDFSLEDSLAAYNKRARSEFDKDVSKYSRKKAGTYIFTAIILGMIVVNFAFDGISTAAFWFNLLADVILVILRMIDAGIQCPILIDANYTNVYLYKTDIMAEYLAWQEEMKIENSKAFKILQYIQALEDQKKAEEELKKNSNNSVPATG